MSETPAKHVQQSSNVSLSRDTTAECAVPLFARNAQLSEDCLSLMQTRTTYASIVTSLWRIAISSNFTMKLSLRVKNLSIKWTHLLSKQKRRSRIWVDRRKKERGSSSVKIGELSKIWWMSGRTKRNWSFSRRKSRKICTSRPTIWQSLSMNRLNSSTNLKANSCKLTISIVRWDDRLRIFDS